MGGGAGIEFTIRPESFTALWNGGRKLTVAKKRLPKIESFDALGYMDGMTNVRGDLLRVTAVALSEATPDDVKWMKGHGTKRGEEYYFGNWGRDDKLPYACVFGGYIRGEWSDIFPLDLTSHIYDTYGWGSTEVTITVEAKRGFREFYQATFEDQEDCDILRMLYGAKK